ncbi:PfkB family carbohydrate kinase [Halanaeroarchaeum sulfurireducens]|uniref:Uncharacterized protein n=1 Tax=Halanaeroarchaeum sulfurireducens TaxID=1604004 RepID=A0A0N9MIQ8_9EURY|nr:PfkB family carbohydrate kinase [Halanaeroarchaeum sulfurireducens]ALG82076.1 hypothetical protein HLASA_1182 [Halanaeroarchaeum sulfurireducens]
MRDIRDRLRSGTTPTVTVLPDGSVDRRSEIVGVDGDQLSRETVGAEIASDGKTFLTEWHGVEQTGQSPNAARQLHELGAETTLIGHLDHSIFDSIPFRTYSMGDPAEIHVYELADGVMMFAAESTDIETWTFDRVETALGPNLESAFGADAVLWMNWAAFPHGTAALERTSELLGSETTLVIDPGAVSTRSTGDAVDLLDGLRNADPAGDTVLSPSRRESNALLDALGIDVSNRSEIATELREYTDIAAVAVHDKPAATVATEQSVVEVPTVEDVEPNRHAGAGDRFNGGVTYALASGWSWAETLTLGNACATHYITHDRCGDRADLLALLERYADDDRV